MLAYTPVSHRLVIVNSSAVKMHHQDFPGDPPGSGGRKAAFHFRRGSSGASSSSTTGDENPTQAGSGSPGLHHHQPQSQAASAQVKKKSGFQITSVTSAQINVSGNNSLADDTESYDDMDESHTEDLSSSDMLDVSVSRATDTGVPDRSSSDETLNSLHGVDTPGIVSPNEPLHPHSLPQGAQHHTSMVNGTMHQYYPQQQQQHPESLGGEPVPTLPVAPVATSSPALASKATSSQFQRPPPLLDSTNPPGGTTQPSAPIAGEMATDPQLQGGVNISNVSAGAAVPSAGPAGFDNTSASGQVAGGTGSAAAPPAPVQPAQTQAATGSRFRVVKLDTNSEPFRKGRWTCTEFYEKEVSHPAASEASKGAELTVESETSAPGISPGVPAVQPLHTLQPYQPPSQDFTSPQAMQSPPQALAQTTPLTYVSPPEVIGGVHMPQPVALATAASQVAPPQAVIPQQLPYTMDPHQVQAQGGYAAPQLQPGVMTQGAVRQPDFIQPTAPFQTQVQPPLPHVTTGISITQPPVSATQQLPHPGQVAQPRTAFPAGQQATHPPSTATVLLAPTQGTTYMPLTALQADLQPLLTPGASLAHVSSGVGYTKTSQLEDAQKLLLQHQGLLGLPRFGIATGGEGSEAGGAAGTLAHMGISAEASAFMAAAGLRTQHAEGEEDRCAHGFLLFCKAATVK